MKILIDVFLRFHLHPADCFKFAYHYAEIRRHPKGMYNDFMSCCVKDGKGNLALIHIPLFVENYAIDLLSGRIKPPDMKKQLMGRKGENKTP